VAGGAKGGGAQRVTDLVDLAVCSWACGQPPACGKQQKWRAPATPHCGCLVCAHAGVV
jgi:hypothetical protein